MRKIVVYIATSADGFIARPDGSIDWLHRPRTAGDYGMGAFRESIDSILLGRKTYEFGLQDSPVLQTFFRRGRAASLRAGKGDASLNHEQTTGGPTRTWSRRHKNVSRP